MENDRKAILALRLRKVYVDVAVGIIDLQGFFPAGGVHQAAAAVRGFRLDRVIPLAAVDDAENFAVGGRKVDVRRFYPVDTKIAIAVGEGDRVCKGRVFQLIAGIRGGGC